MAESNGKYKQVIIARQDLGMTPGKLAAQVSHASMAFLKAQIIENVVETADDTYKSIIIISSEVFEKWILGEYTKTVLRAKNKNQLLKAVTMAMELGMEEEKDFFIIKDNCHTELEPEEVDENGIGHTITCIGFVPMDEEKINPIGRKYQLL